MNMLMLLLVLLMMMMMVVMTLMMPTGYDNDGDSKTPLMRLTLEEGDEVVALVFVGVLAFLWTSMTSELQRAGPDKQMPKEEDAASSVKTGQ